MITKKCVSYNKDLLIILKMKLRKIIIKFLIKIGKNGLNLIKTMNLNVKKNGNINKLN